jgi:virulence factor Mce-like protein
MSGTGRRGGFNPLIAGFIAGVVVALVLALLTKINLDLAGPWTHTHTLTAQVSDVDGMSISSDVRIAGRNVGQVTDVQSKGNYSIVTFHVDDADWPLPADTSASVRLATLLGQKYLQLAPGHSSQQMADNAVIGLQSTKPVVDFDQILNTFDKPTRDHLTSLIRTIAGGVQGQEGTLQQLISNLADLSVHSQTPTQELVKQNGNINSILINLGTTADQLDASRNDFAGVIDNLNSISATLASQQGSALKSFITNTDNLNLTTNAVLGGGAAANLDKGLKQLPVFATYLNTLLTTLVPQTYSFTQPVPGVEPSDRVNNNGGIPGKAAIDLIYEIGDSASQGYGSHNFGTATAPNNQANIFLRQFQDGFDPCIFVAPPNECKWGWHNGQPAGPGSPAVAAAPPTAIPPVAPPSPTPSPGSIPNPIPAPTASPSLVPFPTPSPSPSPTPTPIPSSSPSMAPFPSPSPSPSPSAALSTSYSGSMYGANAGDPSLIGVWDALFTWWWG